MVMKSYGKVMENSKNSEFHGNLFARKKVMEISCPNPPNSFYTLTVGLLSTCTCG